MAIISQDLLFMPHQMEVQTNEQSSSVDLTTLVRHIQALSQAAIAYGMPQALCDELAAEAMSLQMFLQSEDETS